ncbi:MAG TPA: MFS transporter [Candidatus Paceibacterota bacterium]|nr:MFS transporter [Candidatus Paceibacterota bacterium]HSA03669.1 MFS transporter [Candidatus Paceibacterota bacterium]
MKRTNRWWIAVMGALLQMCLGSVYAWSFFQKPIVDACGWRHTQVALTFSLAIGFLGLAAAGGGLCLQRFGPRKLAITGSLLYGAGYLLAGLALKWQSLPLLWAGYGVIGGIGLGLGYVTPVATVARWFPDRKGLVTGMVVMGFGLGALVMSKLIAPFLDVAFNHDLSWVFAGAGMIVGGIGFFAAVFLQNPPSPVTQVRRTNETKPQLLILIGSKQFVLMWLIFFCNITAGIALIGFQSPLLQDLWKKEDPTQSPAALAAAGATLIAVSSICNGLGRIIWGAWSDRIGPLAAFRVMLATQVAAFCVLMTVQSPWLFGGLVCYVLLCYGGGFGVMPAFVLNAFGLRLMPVMYGAILTAWSCAGIAGPQLIAQLKDHPGINISLYAFGLCAAILTLGFLLALSLRSQATCMGVIANRRNAGGREV